MWGWILTAAGLAGLGLAVRHAGKATGNRKPVPPASSPERVEDPFELVHVISGLAHEMRNPLSNLKLNLQLLREDIGGLLADQIEQPAQRRVLQRLEIAANEAGRLERTFEQFLQFASNPRLALQPADVRGLVGELLEFFMPQAATHRITVRAELAPGPLAARLDAVLFKQALLNLLINAQQAMADGGELIVRAGLAAGSGAIRVEVIDTGPGIPAQQVDKIFRAYYSTKKGGTGLGLPICRKIVHAHGGRLTVRSEVGKGSDFCIELPPCPAKNAET